MKDHKSQYRNKLRVNFFLEISNITAIGRIYTSLKSNIESKNFNKAFKLLKYYDLLLFQYRFEICICVQNKYGNYTFTVMILKFKTFYFNFT